MVFDPSYPCLVLSLRDVEFSSGSRCPEVPLNSFALKFSVSRGRFRIFSRVRFLFSLLTLNSDRVTEVMNSKSDPSLTDFWTPKI